ncbi:N-6 DNA methylase [Dolichospermum sp. FACHB-1091]|uniref:N-6 DNA methylase n=1 Tax=Dolichospermum sp. FACHB-1091 TaxID=2692798 RepID=UPI0016816831|nr:N-6 DNA methylase [Dolichospermum sp. FACHB-1091]MBD2442434.1 N-6 DNA methylase [Dolichospermum sp. FACHB-1091]
MKLADILKDSNYKLSQFTAEEIAQLEKSIILKSSKSGETPYTVCLVRKKEIKLTPEEAIRQLYLRVLTERFYYPLNRIQVEYGVNFGREVKRADIVVMDKDRLNTVYMLVEVKKPKLKDGKEQLRSYCHATGAPIAIWTNGDQISYYQRKDPNYFEEISGLPNASQTLADILQIKFTLEDLVVNDKLVKQNKSLKALIEEMEDEVLANAGVDVFEELFKLIFTKLYDEWYSGQGNRRTTRLMEFRNTGQTEAALKTKIQDLFDRSKKKWEGVFSEDAKISLSPSHLSICISSLENVKLFNSNLDVVDEAFEYLINKSSKGEKGQFFTPRYVIDMCVKMLNPQYDEYMIDTAAGSSGFPVHTIFHVWRQILEDEGLSASHLFSLEEKPPRCREYVQEQVFAIDFDEKAVRVARTLNLIAGDGETNVLHLNTLDYEMWDEVTGQEEWDDIYNSGFKRLKRQRPKGSKDYREFQFDVLMANPPFAGDIKETRIINHYDLAKKANGKWETKVGRDILFIERNLDFLKPGGRMAIVLPQGRFNNSSDKNIRDFIAERCRILAVVGLHGNTFKPHTGTKTSVLLVQKWNDDPNVGALCPRQDDYNIFFATMQKSGKDNSGEKIYVKNSDGSGEFLLDDHGHLIIDHDLFNHEGKTQDGIAEAFIEFAKKENLSFFKLSPSVAPFNAVKYQKLMDGLEAVSLKFSELENLITIGAEFYQKQYVDAVHTIRSSKMDLDTLGKCSLLITDGDHSATQYQDEGIYYILSESVKEGYIDENIYRFISPELHQSLQRSELKPRDVVLTKTGVYFGRSAVIPDNFPVANTSAHVGKIKVDESKVNSYYLSTFFNSNYGYLQLRRRGIKATRPEIKLVELNDILIAKPKLEFQNKIEQIIRYVSKIKDNAIEIYQQAENLLLSELNLKDWQPTKETIAVKSFKESFLSFGRLDSEYYQPKYEDLLRRLDNCKIELLKDIVSITKSIEPGSDAYQEDGIPFIRVSNLSKFGITSTEIHISHDLIGNIESLTPKKDTILLSKDGSIGIAYKVDNDLEVITSGAILHLKIKKQTFILPDYLTLVLNSIIVGLQAERDSGGSIIQHWRVSQIENILVPVIDFAIQENISRKIQMSFTKKEQSKQLLEIAKIGVEKAIETDEATATNWINQQLENLGIDLKSIIS